MIFDRLLSRTVCNSFAILCGAGAWALGIAGCGGKTDPIPLLWLGSTGQKAPASTAASIFWIQPLVDGQPGPDVIVDTGAPISIFNPKAFAAGVAEGNGSVNTLTIGGVTLWRAPVVGMSTELSATPNGKLNGGILGFTAFGQFATSFNYRDRSVTFGPSSVPDDVDPPSTIAFTLEGGGITRAPDGSSESWVAPFPASRVVVSAVVEGQPCTLLVDTGASWVGLGSSVFSAIANDGRAILTDDALLVGGATTAFVTRVRTMSAAGFELPRLAAVSGSGIDLLLNTISREVGHTIDGMLGAPFLQQFYVTFDYPNHELQFRRYSTQDHVQDEYARVGIEIQATVSGSVYSYRVSRVFSNTDAAAQHVTAGEDIEQIEGRDVSSLDPATVDRLLLGSPGSTKRIQIGQRALGIRVDDLLPLP